eukprot:6184346-Pleurochrysis_carterae.AAC.5
MAQLAAVIGSSAPARRHSHISAHRPCVASHACFRPHRPPGGNRRLRRTLSRFRAEGRWHGLA